MTTPGRLPRDAFADRLAELEPGAVATFVGALFRASGWEVEADGRTLELRRPGNPPVRRTAVVATAGVDDVPATDRPDLVIAAGPSGGQGTPGGAPDPATVRPDDLYDRLFYAIDRETADALCREYLGCGATAGAATSTAGSDRSDDRDGGGTDVEQEETGEVAPAVPRVNGIGASPPLRDVTWTRLLGGLAIVVVLVAAAGAGGGFGGAPSPATSPPDGAASAGDTRTAIDPTATPGDTATPRSGERTEPGASQVNGGPATVSPDDRYLRLTPTCERPPDLVAVIIVGALRANDPATDAGIRTAWNFSSRASVGSTYANFERYLTQDRFDPLYEHRRAEYAEVYRETGIAAYRVTLTDGSGERHPYFMAFSNEAVDTTRGSVPNRSGEEGCWQLAGMIPE